MLNRSFFLYIYLRSSSSVAKGGVIFRDTLPQVRESRATRKSASGVGSMTLDGIIESQRYLQSRIYGGRCSLQPRDHCRNLCAPGNAMLL